MVDRQCPWCDEVLEIGPVMKLWSVPSIVHMRQHALDDIARQAGERDERDDADEPDDRTRR